MNNKQIIMLSGGAAAVIALIVVAIMVLVPKPNEIVKCAHFSLASYAQTNGGNRPDPDYYVRTVGLCVNDVAKRTEKDSETTTALIEALQDLGWWDHVGQRYVPNWRRMDDSTRIRTVRRALLPHMSVVQSPDFRLIMHKREDRDDGTIWMEYEVKSSGQGIPLGRLHFVLEPIDEPEVEPEERRYYRMISLGG
ncbi:MAG: hypothetical protein Alpg2KO_04630 [Alphaproteobacteria bacterium]